MDLLRRNIQDYRQLADILIGILGRGPDLQLIVFGPAGNGHLRLQMDMLLIGGLVVVFHHDIVIGEILFHIAGLPFEVTCHIAALLDLRCLRLPGIEAVRQRFQDLIFHFHRGALLPGNILCFRPRP